MRRNACSLAVFAGVDLFALNFYLETVERLNNFQLQKPETLGYPMVKTAPLCVPSEL